MLFNSYVFIFAFLPIAALLFYGIRAAGHPRAAMASLVLASLFYYGWWNPWYLWLILASTLFNFVIARRVFDSQNSREQSALLTVGVCANLALLGYYKYMGFFLENLNAVFGAAFSPGEILLPLAISFFTFQQIAYLIDVRRGKPAELDLLKYGLFVTFFPQLIAGPIVHHAEMMPQFEKAKARGPISPDLVVGIALFSIGLFKKVVIADGIAAYSNPVFARAELGVALSPLEAWAGAVAYGFQLYFDFSGYSDMALGSARVFGIRLPVNFFSPYKATGILEFWRRWHITLGRVIESYLFQPLNLTFTRLSARRQDGPLMTFLTSMVVPLMLTYAAVGIWHGAGWSFVVFGVMHGGYAVVNHAYREWRRRSIRKRKRAKLPIREESAARLAGFRLITYVALLFSFVVFRAESLSAAWIVIRQMLSFGDLVLPGPFLKAVGPIGEWLRAAGVDPGRADLLAPEMLWLFPMLFAVVWLAPNSIEIMREYDPAIMIRRFASPFSDRKRFEWRMTPRWAIATALLAIWGIMNLNRATEFLYFNF